MSDYGICGFEIHTFRIQYVDGNYQLVEWTEDQLNQVYEDMYHGDKVSLVNKCIFKLEDIRAITYLPPVKDEQELDDDEEPETVMVTEEGTYDKEVYDLLVSMGYDLGTSQERRKR